MENPGRVGVGNLLDGLGMSYPLFLFKPCGSLLCERGQEKDYRGGLQKGY